MISMNHRQNMNDNFYNTAKWKYLSLHVVKARLYGLYCDFWEVKKHTNM